MLFIIRSRLTSPATSDRPLFDSTGLEVAGSQGRADSITSTGRKTRWFSVLPLSQIPNLGLNASINNPFSKTHCRPSLNPAQEEADRQKAAQAHLVHLHGR